MSETNASNNVPESEFYFELNELHSIEVLVGQTFTIRFGGITIRPPYLLLESFISLPDIIEQTKQEITDSDGAYEDAYTLMAKAKGEGMIEVGFHRIQDGEITHLHCIKVLVLANENI